MTESSKLESPTPGPTKRHLAIGMAMGGVVDGLQWLSAGFPPVTWVLDGVAALGFFALYGFRPLLLVPIVIELIPGLALAPTWFIAAGILHATAKTTDSTSLS